MTLTLAAITVGNGRDITIEADDFLRFNLKEIEAEAGSQLTINLVNTGKIPSLQHNFVLLAAEMDPARFGNAAMNAQAEGFIPANLKDSVIAHTAMAEAGQKVSTTFTVPDQGTYVYICSYPGHYSVSRGKLVVR
jgi:azurin